MEAVTPAGDAFPMTSLRKVHEGRLHLLPSPFSASSAETELDTEAEGPSEPE